MVVMLEVQFTLSGIGKEKVVEVARSSGLAVGLEGIHYLEDDQGCCKSVVESCVEMTAILWAEDIRHGIENILQAEGFHKGGEFVVTESWPEDAGELAGVEPRAPLREERGIGVGVRRDGWWVGPEIFEEVVLVGGIVSGEGAGVAKIYEAGPLGGEGFGVFQVAHAETVQAGVLSGNGTDGAADLRAGGNYLPIVNRGHSIFHHTVRDVALKINNVDGGREVHEAEET